MKGKGSGWKGESRRHSLARKGVKTVLPDGRRFDVSKFIASGKFPEIDVSRHNWSLKLNPDGTMKLSLGNMSDAGWYWSGDESDLALFLYRIMRSQVKDQFINDMKDDGLTYEMLLPIILESIESSDGNGIYALTGDNIRWKFGESYEIDVDSEMQYFTENWELSKKDQEGIIEEYEWRSKWDNMNYDEFEKSDEFDEIKKKLIHEIKTSYDFEDFDANMKELKDDVMWIMMDYDMNEGYEQMHNAFMRWKDKQKKEGRIVKEKSMKASGKTKEIDLSQSNLYLKGFDRDINGNKTIKVSFPNGRAFSIQTLQNMPKTHSMRIGKKDDLGSISNSDLKIIEKELINYIEKHGSKNQKSRLKVYGD